MVCMPRWLARRTNPAAGYTAPDVPTTSRIVARSSSLRMSSIIEWDFSEPDDVRPDRCSALIALWQFPNIRENTLIRKRNVAVDAA